MSPCCSSHSWLYLVLPQWQLIAETQPLTLTSSEDDLSDTHTRNQVCQKLNHGNDHHRGLGEQQQQQLGVRWRGGGGVWGGLLTPPSFFSLCCRDFSTVGKQKAAIERSSGPGRMAAVGCPSFTAPPPPPSCTFWWQDRAAGRHKIK